MYRKYFKNIFDISSSISLIIITLPIQILLFILLFFYNKGKVFFIQERPGKNEQLFSLIKFKTMNSTTDSEGNLLNDSERVTALGKLLRKFGLDELPQLYLILVGKMSFIGPRPLLTEYLKKYPENVRKRHDVKPGITGWAQVHGRNKQTWEERFNYDLLYVENYNFKLDLLILYKTIQQILFKKDKGDTIMEKY